MDQANNPNKRLTTGKEVKNVYQTTPTGLISVNPIAKKPDERDLLMGGILDGDDDMTINRNITKSAPPELYLQQKNQLQQEENSYLYTKEYRDYYKEQNNPRLQKPLTRPDIFEHPDIQQLQQQLTGLTITDNEDNTILNRGNPKVNQKPVMISKQISPTPPLQQQQQIQPISRKQSEVMHSGSSPQKDLVIQDNKNTISGQPIEVIRTGSPQAVVVVGMNNYTSLPMQYSPNQQLNNPTTGEGSTNPAVVAASAPPGISHHKQSFSSSNTSQPDAPSVNSNIISGGGQQQQAVQIQQQQQLQQQQQYYQQQQQQQAMMQGYQMMYYPGQQQPSIIPGTIPPQVNNPTPMVIPGTQQPTGMTDQQQQYYPVAMQMGSYAYPPNMMYSMPQVVPSPQQMLYPQQSQQQFQVDNPYGVMINNDNTMYGYQGGYQVVPEEDHRRNNHSNMQQHNLYQQHRNYQNNINNNKNQYIPAHARDREAYHHNNNNNNGQNHQNYQQHGYNKNRKQHNNNSNGNVYGQQNYNTNNQFLQHSNNQNNQNSYSSLNPSHRNNNGIQQFNQFQEVPNQITIQHHPNNNYTNTTLAAAVPFAMIFDDLINACKDQNSSRTIQKHFEDASLEEKNKLFEKILPEALNLMVDQFGNYVIQKLLEQGTAEHKEKLFGILKGNVESLSVQTYGCRVIQKVLEEIKDRKDLYQPLVKELNSQNTKILACIQDQNGNHVIQKCFEALPSHELMQIVGQVTGHIQELAFHPYGCRVIQRILEFCTVQQTLPIYAELMKNLIPLCECQYGNYIIQYIIEKGNKQQKDQILESVQRNFVELSMNKFASNVTEKSVVFSEDTYKAGVLDVLLNSSQLNSNPLESGVVQLTKNAFGNYVVQRLYEKANQESKLRMCQFLLQNQEVYNEIIANSFGKHVLSYIEKNRVDMPYSVNGQQQQFVQREQLQQQMQFQPVGYTQNNNNNNNNSNVNRNQGYSNPNNNQHHHNNQHNHGHHRNPFLYQNQNNNNNSNNSNNHHQQHHYQQHNYNNYDNPNNQNNHNHYRRSNHSNNNSQSNNNNNY